MCELEELENFDHTNKEYQSHVRNIMTTIMKKQEPNMAQLGSTSQSTALESISSSIAVSSNTILKGRLILVNL